MSQEKIWDAFQNDLGKAASWKGVGPRHRWLARRIKSGASILNIGVGNGSLEDLLCNKGCVVHSLDPSEKTIETLRVRLGLGDRAKTGYSQEIPFADLMFDAVIMSEVLEHLDEKTMEITIKEVVRVLKTGGEFIGTVPAEEVLSDNHVVCPHCGKDFHRWGHLQSFSTASLGLAIANQGMRLDLIKRLAFVEFSNRSLWGVFKSCVRYALGRIGEPMAQANIVFSAKK